MKYEKTLLYYFYHCIYDRKYLQLTMYDQENKFLLLCIWWEWIWNESRASPRLLSRGQLIIKVVLHYFSRKYYHKSMKIVIFELWLIWLHAVLRPWSTGHTHKNNLMNPTIHLSEGCSRKWSVLRRNWKNKGNIICMILKEELIRAKQKDQEGNN